MFCIDYVWYRSKFIQSFEIFLLLFNNFWPDHPSKIKQNLSKIHLFVICCSLGSPRPRIPIPIIKWSWMCWLATGTIRSTLTKKHLIFFGSKFKISSFQTYFTKCKPLRNDKWKQESHSSQEILSFTVGCLGKAHAKFYATFVAQCVFPLFLKFCGAILLYIFNRPCVAGAVLQTPLSCIQ